MICRFFQFISEIIHKQCDERLLEHRKNLWRRICDDSCKSLSSVLIISRHVIYDRSLPSRANCGFKCADCRLWSLYQWEEYEGRQKIHAKKKKKKIWSRFRKVDITSTLLAIRGCRISILAKDHLIKGEGRVKNFWASHCFHGERSGIQ